jgi:hypothetical protein
MPAKGALAMRNSPLPSNTSTPQGTESSKASRTKALSKIGVAISAC